MALVARRRWRYNGTMGMVLWNTTMSLDGYIAGPDDALDWVFRFAGPAELTADVMRSTGAILAGRRSYDVSRKPGQRSEAREAFGGAWRGPQFVLTHHAPDDETDPDFTFLSGDIEQATAVAMGAAAGRGVLVIGADVARQCIDRGLIDEVEILLMPVLLGGGVRLFERPGATVELRTVSVTRYGEVTRLRFRVLK